MSLKKIKDILQGLFLLKRSLILVWHSSRVWTITSLILLILNSVLPLLSLYLTKFCIDNISKAITAEDKGIAFEQVAFFILLLAIVAIIINICKSLTNLVNNIQSEKFVNYMTGIIHRKSIEIDLEYFENSEYYDTFHRVQADGLYRPYRVLNNVLEIFQNGFSIFFLSGLLVSLHWSVFIVLIIAVIPGAIIRLKYSEKMYRWKRQRTHKQRSAYYYNSLITLSEFAKEVRIFNLGKLFAQRFSNIRQKLYREEIKIVSQQTFSELIGNISGTIASFAVYGFIAYRTVKGALSLGDLVMYHKAFTQLQTAFTAILTTVTNLYSDSLYISNLYEFLDLKSKIVDPPEAKPIPYPMEKGIRFNNVNFQYQHSTRQALKDINLTIKPGEVIALVGENGSGKTTLIKLLCRLYDPTNGSITFDGIDIRQFQVAQLRQQISVIFQDYVQYCFRAEDNIWVGNVDNFPETQKIVAAAQQAGIDEVISKLPQGYDTMLGKMFENGEQLSIGQWQKVALARAFLRDSQLIVLDEPTSALDPKAEYEVFQQFRQLLNGQSAILITHRLSTVRMADRIYVLNQGRIVESGTHEELIQLDKVYANFFEKQAQNYR